MRSGPCGKRPSTARSTFSAATRWLALLIPAATNFTLRAASTIPMSES